MEAGLSSLHLLDDTALGHYERSRKSETEPALVLTNTLDPPARDILCLLYLRMELNSPPNVLNCTSRSSFFNAITMDDTSL